MMMRPVMKAAAFALSERVYPSPLALSIFRSSFISLNDDVFVIDGISPIPFSDDDAVLVAFLTDSLDISFGL